MYVQSSHLSNGVNKAQRRERVMLGVKSKIIWISKYHSSLSFIVIFIPLSRDTWFLHSGFSFFHEDIVNDLFSSVLQGSLFLIL